MPEQYCCECGAGLPADAKFCWKCGTTIVGPPIAEGSLTSSTLAPALAPQVSSTPEEPVPQVMPQITFADTPAAPQPDASTSSTSIGSMRTEMFCPLCGSENPADFSVCHSCGHALQEFPWTSSADDMKHRHGCLTTWLIFMIIVNAAYAVVLLLWPKIFGEELDVPTWSIYVSVVAYVITIICALALFRWKKWGFYVLLSLCTINFVLSLIGGNPAAAFLGLVPALILYGVLHIGDTNKGWGQLE